MANDCNHSNIKLAGDHLMVTTKGVKFHVVADALIILLMDSGDRGLVHAAESFRTHVTNSLTAFFTLLLST